MTRRRPLSLAARLTLAASVALIAFLGITGLVLDAAFRESARTAVQDRLQGASYTLLAAAELGLDGVLFLPDATPEPRLSRPGSGLYARVTGPGYQWNSESLLGLELTWPDPMLPGETRFQGPVAGGSEELFQLSMGVAWEMESGGEVPFTFSVAESTNAYLDQIAGFRRALWGWLGAATLVLLAVQGGVLRWSLRPLRQVSEEVGRMQAGESEGLEGRYPRELTGLTNSINAFVTSERRQLERFRNSLADLAHALKTPLTVLRTGLEHPEDSSPGSLLGQVGRMDDLVQYQLQRARTSGHRTFSRPVGIADHAEPVVVTLEQAYRDKQVRCEYDIEPGAEFYGEEGDLTELLGNLLENAFKWCQGQVLLTARLLADSGLLLQVDDDGPGIPPDQTERLLQRGARGDEQVAGHGIGLAVVRQIVDSYSGTMEITVSDLGGARIALNFDGPLQGRQDQQ